MGKVQIEFDALKQTVARQNRVFTTIDVSQDAQMKETHPELARHGQYNSFVGRELSKQRVPLGITEIRKSPSRGSRWEKNGLTKSVEPLDETGNGDAPITSEERRTGIGPQCSQDSQFTSRMRLHQSWYRANVLQLPYGTGPTPQATSWYGNMLARADAEAGRNFLTPEIAQVARNRVAQGGGKVETFRLFHNMLSSQPMCFNLFGPLVNDLTLAQKLLSPILPEKVEAVIRVAIEWAPEPRENFLNDNTSFDAFIEYRTVDGLRCALGVETKLTEPFSQKEYDGERYRRWMRVLHAPWRPEAGEVVHFMRHNQIWRDQLLSVALQNQTNSPYAKVRLMVVRHAEDAECLGAMADYRKLLQDGDDSLIDMPMNKIVGLWTELLAGSPHQRWIDDFNTRYLSLDQSSSCTC